MFCSFELNVATIKDDTEYEIINSQQRLVVSPDELRQREVKQMRKKCGDEELCEGVKRMVAKLVGYKCTKDHSTEREGEHR